MKAFRKELQSFIDHLDVPKQEDKQADEPLSVSTITKTTTKTHKLITMPKYNVNYNAIQCTLI